ncbi:TIGR03013 family XrtA/PEP-CTERM system glycosyltransferase [Noviherbaspirillum pedocola]|uniref:TIGR03013 family PEP-CTERM/XrtA system glycosyltransferase n=1 Tax=Noviherbaspirillum pedocola TaxID=2801341 RepID=A0A934SSE5_9BURK|nr:TIGR03013 family XrtA/PEP-CTERM system glycosyltransferase [Noviherbaspirillum pedocola]MBK4734316.1 TIGR03013 family PEP-CTERM/XrtA system glycosyltransferase [Noviherbaspirillum pedocola]
MLKISNHYVSKIASALLLLEIGILIASAYLAAAIRLPGAGFLRAEDQQFFPSAIAFALSMVFAMTALGMYQHDFREGFRNTLLRLMPSFLLGFAITALVFYMMPSFYFGRGVLLMMIAIAACGILAVRVLLFKSSESRLLESRILFLGSGTLAKECADLAANNNGYHKYDVVGFVPMPDETPAVASGAVLPVGKSLVSIARERGAQEIVVAVQNRRGGAFPIRELLDCKLNGIKVIDSATFFEREACQIRVDSLQPSWFVFGTGFDQGFLRSLVKRAFDLFASMLIFIGTLPVTAITALLIYLEDGAPIFYRQERVGEDGYTFMVLKFRSMRKDAEKDGAPKWASTGDPRTTRVGRVIRKLRIDEIPQILNVLKGEMSFVGPRPERPFFVEQLCEQVPYYNMRHSIKPGITGLAQVRYQYGASVEDAVQKLQYDLYYVKNNSLFLDLLILLDTLQVVLLSKGSR